VRTGSTLATAGVEHFGGREVALVAARPVAVAVRRDQRLRTVVRAPAELSGPLPRGARVGSVTVFRDGARVRSVPLVTAARVPEAGFVRKVWSALWRPLVLLIALGIAAWVITRRRRRMPDARRRPAAAPERSG
jgi:D-alanyl-D-alanine carboxypeptidase (penicillin-binding protein 5/6)